MESEAGADAYHVLRVLVSKLGLAYQALSLVELQLCAYRAADLAVVSVAIGIVPLNPCLQTRREDRVRPGQLDSRHRPCCGRRTPITAFLPR
jgi:hypothetical protein